MGSLGIALAAPAIVQIGNIMSVSSPVRPKGQELISQSEMCFFEWATAPINSWLVGWKARQVTRNTYYLVPVGQTICPDKLLSILDCPITVERSFDGGKTWI